MIQPVILFPEEKEVACSLHLHPKDKLKSKRSAGEEGRLILFFQAV